MFAVPTVLIIGAGASHEFGLPLGTQLTSKVAAAVDFKRSPSPQNAFFWDRLSASLEITDELIGSGKRLASIAPQFATLDETLHFLSEDTRAVGLGKMAVANEIAKSEFESHLYAAMHGNGDSTSVCEGSWAARFLRMALSTTRRSDIPQLFGKVTIVDFNYDRVLPQYLYWSLQQNYGISPIDAAECVQGLKILHPYGWLGSPQFLDPRHPVPLPQRREI